MKKYIKRILNNKWFPYILITLVWSITILPSCINANWFFLDDPTSVDFGRYTSRNLDYIFSPSKERFIPFYWYYRGFVFRLFGNSPTPSYVIQAIAILCSLFAIYWIVKKIIDNKKAGLLAVLIFITGSSIAENTYTIGKQEPMVLLSLLLVIQSSIILYGKTSIVKRVGCFISVTFFTLSAMWTKEPSILVMVLGITFLISSIVYKNKNHLPEIAIFLGILISKLPQLIFENRDTGSTYTNYSITFALIKANVISYAKQNPDYIILLSLTIFLVLLFLYKNFHQFHIPEIKSKDRINIIIIFSMFTIAIGYTAILFAWRWTMGYYLYVPLGLLSIVFASLIFKSNYINRKILLSILIILGLSRIISIPYNVYAGVAQYNSNRMYSESIYKFQDIAVQNSKLIVENWDFYGEEPYQSNILLDKVYLKSDLKVEGVSDLIEGRTITAEIIKLYGIKEIPDSKDRWPQKDDYILVYTSNLTSFWTLRGVMPNLNSGSKLLAMGYELELISKSEVNYKLPFMELVDKRVKWNFRETFQGYILYKVTKIPVSKQN